MSSANKDSFISSFPCLKALAGTSSTVLNRSGERGRHCLRGKVSSFSTLMLPVGFFFVDILYQVKFPSLLRAFVMNKCWIL